MALGLTISFGAVALAVEKRDARLQEDQDICDAPHMVAAAIGFGVADILLWTFPSPRHGAAAAPGANATANATTHVGVRTDCQLGHTLAQAGAAVAVASIVLLAAAATPDARALARPATDALAQARRAAAVGWRRAVARDSSAATAAADSELAQLSEPGT